LVGVTTGVVNVIAQSTVVDNISCSFFYDFKDFYTRRSGWSFSGTNLFTHRRSALQFPLSGGTGRHSLFEPTEKEKNLLSVIKWNFGLAVFNPLACPLYRVGYSDSSLKKIMSLLNTVFCHFHCCTVHFHDSFTISHQQMH
jgi:hypothetical protein